MSPAPLGDVLVEVLGDELAPGRTSFLDLFAEDGVLECPFAPPGGMHRLVGRDAITTYFTKLQEVERSDGVTVTFVHRSPGQRATVLEYHGIARNQITGERYRQRYIAMVRTGGGRIRLFREYWDPRPVVAAHDGPQLWVEPTA